jgi:hypothetical protein
VPVSITTLCYHLDRVVLYYEAIVYDFQAQDVLLLVSRLGDVDSDEERNGSIVDSEEGRLSAWCPQRDITGRKREGDPRTQRQ